MQGKKKKPKIDAASASSAGDVKKSNYRQRAHANPLTDANFEHPLSPARMDWGACFPGRGGGGAEWLDVGCGYGGLLMSLAPAFPERLMLGFEIRDKVAAFGHDKIVALRSDAEGAKADGGYTNVDVIRTNAMKFMPQFFAKGQLSKIMFCFPDPHFKKQNHRRRVISDSLLPEYAYALALGGICYTVTDVLELHEWMVRFCESFPLLERLGAEEEAADPITPFITNTTDESIKVERNKGQKYVALFRRVEAPLQRREPISLRGAGTRAAARLFRGARASGHWISSGEGLPTVVSGAQAHEVHAELVRLHGAAGDALVGWRAALLTPAAEPEAAAAAAAQEGDEGAEASGDRPRPQVVLSPLFQSMLDVGQNGTDEEADGREAAKLAAPVLSVSALNASSATAEVVFTMQADVPAAAAEAGEAEEGAGAAGEQECWEAVSAVGPCLTVGGAAFTAAAAGGGGSNHIGSSVGADAPAQALADYGGVAKVVVGCELEHEMLSGDGGFSDVYWALHSTRGELPAAAAGEGDAGRSGPKWDDGSHAQLGPALRLALAALSARGIGLRAGQRLVCALGGNCCAEPVPESGGGSFEARLCGGENLRDVVMDYWLGLRWAEEAAAEAPRAHAYDKATLEGALSAAGKKSNHGRTI